MANLPGPWIPAGEEGHHLFTVGLGGDVLTVFGDITDKEVRVAEHHKVLFTSPLPVAQQLLARHIEQFDRHAPGIADAVELRVGIAVGQAHRRLPDFPRLAEHALAQLAWQFRQHLNLGLHTAVGLGMGVAQVAGAFTVLIDDAHGGLDDVPGHRGFVVRNQLLRRDRPAMLPGKPGAGQGPAQHAESQQPQQQPGEEGAQAQPESY
ncbi:hypothetical protein D3C87_1023940 [compost metagenome]